MPTCLAQFGRPSTCPSRSTTDVNAAALGEHRWGAGVGLDSLVYITVGTGIGGGAVVAGRPLCTERATPKWGTAVSPTTAWSTRSRVSGPYHVDCLEGLASGPAIEARWGHPAESLPEGHQCMGPRSGILSSRHCQHRANLVTAADRHWRRGDESASSSSR